MRIIFKDGGYEFVRRAVLEGDILKREKVFNSGDYTVLVPQATAAADCRIIDATTEERQALAAAGYSLKG